MSRILLTDDQLWLILHSEKHVSDHILAQAIGAKETTVHAARWRLQKQGWTCRVSYGTCQLCGEPFIRRGFRTGRRQYHAECYLKNKQLENVPREKERWENHPAAVQEIILERGHRYDRYWQEVTQERATNSGSRWQLWEDELIVADDRPPDRELAIELGRSLKAVRRRRQEIVRNQRIAVDS